MSTIRKWNEILRHERESRGWSQGEVAEAVGTDQKVVSRWERGISRPSPYFRKKLIEVFGRSAVELGLVQQSSAPETPLAYTSNSSLPSVETSPLQETSTNALQPIQLLVPSGTPLYVAIQVHQQAPAHVGMTDLHLIQSTYQDDQNKWISPEMNGVDRLRRKLLKQLLQVAGASIFASQELLNDDAWERLSRVVNIPHSIDESVLTHLERLTDSYWELYRSALAKVDLLSSVLGHLQTVTRLLEHSQPTSIQRRLCSLVSNTAQIVGELYFDMNKCTTAMSYYDLAIESAQEVDNHRLYSLALGRKGFLPIYMGHSEESLPFLQQAYSLAQQTTTGKSKSWLVTMQAEAFSNLKSKRDCLNALEQAERVIDFTDEGEDAHWTGFGRSTLAGYKGICYMRLEMPEEARKVLQQSLKSLPPGPTRRKSIVLSDLAITYVQQGEIEEACQIATESLLVATQSKSARAIQRLREVQTCLSPWNDHANVKGFNAQLAPFIIV